MRVGYSAHRSSVNSSSSSVTFTVSIYTQNQYRYNDNQTMNLSGGKLGNDFGFNNTSGSNSSGGGAVRRTTRTYTYNYSDRKQSHRLIATTARVSGAYNGVTPSVDIQYTVPPRPYRRPTAPTNVEANWSSGNPRTSWTRRDSSDGKYGTQTIQWGYYDDTGWNNYRGSTVVSAGTTAYLWGSETKNRAYRYRVRANNSSGSSGWAYMPSGTYLYNNPADPTSARASVGSGSSNITVSWSNNHYIVGSTSIEIYRSVNGGSYSAVKTGLSKYATSWVDSNPGAGSNRYRIRVKHAEQTFDDGDLYSGWDYTNTVSTIVEPDAPTHLYPFGDIVDFTGDVTFTWQHNDGGDGAGQSHINVRYREQGSSSWTWLADGVETSVEGITVEAGTLDNGVDYEWQVSTQGNTSKGFGDWSTVANVTGATQPTVTIEADKPATVVEEMPLTVGWLYQQDQSYDQVAYEVELYTVGAGGDLGSLVASASGSNASTEAEVNAAMTNGDRYILRVRARSSIGLWSGWAQKNLVVDLLPPAEGTVSLSYDADTGQMTITLTTDEAVPGETSPAVTADLQRRIDGGEWFTVIEDVPAGLETAVTDQLPTITGLNEYRFYVKSAVPTYAYTEVKRMRIGEDQNEQWLFLNYGSAFADVVRMKCGLSSAGTFDRASTVQPLLGRSRPFFMQGQQLSHEQSFDGQIVYQADDCAPPMEENPGELLCAPWFEYSGAWEPQSDNAGSGINPVAHYRGKDQGYLLTPPIGKYSSINGPIPMECGSEPEVVAENKWKYSMISRDMDGISKSHVYEWEQIADGVQIVRTADYATAAFSLVYTSSAGLITDLSPNSSYSWLVPVRNDGQRTIHMSMNSWIRNEEGNTVSTAYTNLDLEPGEQAFGVMEGLESGDDGYDLRFSLYYAEGEERPGVGDVFTLLDGITVTETPTAVDFPFNGGGAVPSETFVRNNLIAPSFKDGDIDGWLTQTGVEARTIYSHGLDNKAQARVTALAGAPTTAYFGGLVIPIRGGEWVGLGASFLNNEGNPWVRTRFLFRDASGGAVGGAPYLTDRVQTTDEYQRIVGAVQAPADAVDVRPYAYLYSSESGDAPTEGQSYYTDHWSLTVGPSEADVVQAVETFFDGNTDPDEGTVIRWAGEAYKSVAVEATVQTAPDDLLYSWTGAPDSSASQQIAPGEPAEYPRLEGGKTYDLGMYVQGPDIERRNRVNLARNASFEAATDVFNPQKDINTSGWAFSEDWSSQGGRSITMASTFGRSGSVNLSDQATPADVGVDTFNEKVLTIGLDWMREEAETNGNSAYISLRMSTSDVENFDDVRIDLPDYAGSNRLEESVTLPQGGELLTLRVVNPGVRIWVDGLTVESGITDGSWFTEETQGILAGAQNVKSVNLAVALLNPDGTGYADYDLEFDSRSKDELDARWIHLSGEYEVPEEYDGYRLRMYIYITVNGQWGEDATDWYVGGASLREQWQYQEAESGPDSDYEDWVEAQNDAHIVCVRDPYGARFFGAMSGLSLNSVESMLNSATISFKVTEVLYDEKTLTHLPVLNPYIDIQSTSGGGAGGPGVLDPFVIDPYSTGGDS